ncbi:hypothetical protein Leryth_007747 [Lithospermum erythrorhizon]|nr:hypothetical protein Leryth_007747 [Lithospermum erythrorhizon]
MSVTSGLRLVEWSAASVCRSCRRHGQQLERETEEESTSEESTNGQRIISRKRMRLDQLRYNDDDEVSTRQIIPPPSTTVELEAAIGACEESHGGEKEECVVETSTTSTNSVKTTKCRRVEMGLGGARPTEEIEFVIGKDGMCEPEWSSRTV